MIAYVLILTAMVTNNHEHVIHTETIYPTEQACHEAYQIDLTQFRSLSDAVLSQGTCLKVE